jgi:hypothetical protein
MMTILSNLLKYGNRKQERHNGMAGTQSAGGGDGLQI